MVFWKDRKIPVIIIGEDEVPIGLFHPRFQSQLVAVCWCGHSPIGYLEGDRLAANVLWYAMHYHFELRRYYKEKPNTWLLPFYLEFQAIWERVSGEVPEGLKTEGPVG